MKEDGEECPEWDVRGSGRLFPPRMIFFFPPRPGPLPPMLGRHFRAVPRVPEWPRIGGTRSVSSASEPDPDEWGKFCPSEAGKGGEGNNTGESGTEEELCIRANRRL